MWQLRQTRFGLVWRKDLPSRFHQKLLAGDVETTDFCVWSSLHAGGGGSVNRVKCKRALLNRRIGVGDFCRIIIVTPRFLVPPPPPGHGRFFVQRFLLREMWRNPFKVWQNSLRWLPRITITSINQGQQP